MISGLNEDFIKELEKRLAGNLPGTIAHEPLRATPAGSLMPTFEHKHPARPGSVLILLYEDNDRICFPLIKRTDYKGLHSGQISLPGGKKEKEETENETAIRETQEEIGVNPNQIKILGHLSKFFVIPSNFMVTPVVAWALDKPAFIPDPREVDRVLKGGLSDLIQDDAITSKEILVNDRFRLNAPHFEVEGEIVWGATAMMLNEFRVIIRELYGRV